MKTKLTMWLLMSIVGVLSYAQDCGCNANKNQSGLGTSKIKALAKALAPIYSTTDARDQWPKSGQSIWDKAGGNKGCGGSLNDGGNGNSTFSKHWSSSSGDIKNQFYTYYYVRKKNKIIYVDYWWTYWRQPNCYASSGGHDFDWEHATMVAYMSSNSANSVKFLGAVFYQHSGWYTKKAANMTMDGNRPLVYAGWPSNGLYHKAENQNSNFTVSTCCYYGDRNESDIKLNTKDMNLSQMNCDRSWKTSNTKWSGNYNPNFRDRKVENYKGCKGESTLCGTGDSQQGCERSNAGTGTTMQSYWEGISNGVNINLRGDNEEYIIDLTEYLEDDLSEIDDNSVIIFPNPTSTGKIEFVGFDPKLPITIVNMAGQKVATIEAGIALADVSSLKVGQYFAKQGKLTEKFIIE